MPVHRNRIIYQSEALFVSPDATGAHFTGAAIDPATTDPLLQNILADVGPGPYGLFTPPASELQVLGQDDNNLPALNNAGNLMGWQSTVDAWPKWSPTTTLLTTPAVDATNTISLGVAGSMTLTAVDQAASGNGIKVQFTDGNPVDATYDAVNKILAIDYQNGVTTITAINNIISGLTPEFSLTPAGGATGATLLPASVGTGGPGGDGEYILSGGSDEITGAAKAHGSIIKQLKRVQTANYGFTVNRQDINQFGHLARLDSLIIEAPTVNLDFSYYLLDGYNERMLEFVTNGSVNSLSGALAPELYQAGNNFFILTVPEARDAVNGDVALEQEQRENDKSVIALGNGFITDYSVDISVGAIPTASVTVEGMNIRSDFGTTGSDNPGINIKDGSLISDAWDTTNGYREAKTNSCTGLYSLPATTSGYTGCEDISALRPGDVVLNLSDGAMISKQQSGDTGEATNGSAHVQSVSINVPLARTTLQRLGNTFGFSKSVDVPVNVSMTVSAVLADLKEGNLIDLMCKCEGFDIGVTLFRPECGACELKDPSNVAMRYTLKGARLESENFTSTIGDNKTVEMTFNAQVGGPDDPSNGLFISGIEAAEATIPGMPPAWTGRSTEITDQPSDPVSGYLLGYRS